MSMLEYLDTIHPIRNTALGLCVMGLLLSLFSVVALHTGVLPLLVSGGLVGWWAGGTGDL